MTTSRMEELSKAVQLLKETEQLQDAETRRRLQELILNALDPEPTAAVTSKPAPVPTAPTRSPKPRQTQRNAIPPSEQAVLTGLKTIATHERPVSCADLEGLVDGMDSGQISKALSRLHKRKLVRRVTALNEVDRRGAHRSVYKYYV